MKGIKMKIDILKKAERFDVNIDSFDYLNNNISLYVLYAPIIGNIAVQIYEYLIIVYKIKIEANFCKTSIKQLINRFNLDLEQFAKNLSLLESTGLIKTYQTGDENNPKLIFVVQKILNFNDFMTKNELKNALKNSLTPNEFNELRYIFNKHLSNVVDISEDKNWLNNNLSNPISSNDNNLFINWKEVQNSILLLGYKVNFLDSDKEIILNFYLNSTITLSGLINLIVPTLSKIKNSDYHKFNVQKFIDNTKSPIQTSINFNKVINRNADIFTFNADIKKFTSIVNDYKSFTCENYLHSLTKQSISLDERKTLSQIKDKFALTDSAINVLIDYSMYKNVGHFHSNYVYKIANTVNNANILELDEIIKYLQHIDNKIKPNIHSIKSSPDTSTNDEDIWN